MTNIRIAVDGEMLFDGELDNWITRPPEFITSMMKPGTEPRAYTKPLMLALVDALVAQQDTILTVHTLPSGWTLTVQAAVLTI